MSFTCLNGCSNCCGCVPISKESIISNADKITNIEEYKELNETEVFPLTDDGKCAFLDRDNHKCRIYDQRPEICRMYGTSERLEIQCPYLRPDGKKRRAVETKRFLRFMDKYQKEILRGFRKCKTK